MLERLVGFALSQRLFVALSVLLLIGAGFVVLPSLPIDAFPDVSPVQVKVIMKASGLTPRRLNNGSRFQSSSNCLDCPTRRYFARRQNTRSPTLPSILKTALTSIGRATRSRNGYPISRAIFRR